VPRRFGSNAPPHERAPVAWYAPPVLLQAGQELVQSQNFQRNLDRREHFSPALTPIDLSAHVSQDALWIDFVSDTGDGGNASFEVGRAVFAPELSVRDERGAPLALPEGDVLLFGGDLAYPGASPAVYQYRFFEPFTMARDAARAVGAAAPKRSKVVAAIPQNHDWFDSAATFCRYFVAQDKGDFLGLATPQRQTYFALRLPHRFWVLGFDWALTGDLDRQQFEAFRALLDPAREDGIAPGDDVLLLYPEPYWTRPLGDGAPEGYPRRYQRLEAQIEARGAAVRARLAGDLHHYRRESLRPAGKDSTRDETHLITCGSGGAFLHPTHGVDVSATKAIDRTDEPGALDAELRHRVRVGRVGAGRAARHEGDASAAAHGSFTPRRAWPPPEVTRPLAWRNLGALFTVRFARAPWRQRMVDSALDVWHSNFAFALAIGMLYGINAYVNSFVFSRSFVPDGFAPMEQLGFLEGASSWLRAMVFSPLATGVNIAMLAGCVRVAWEGPAHWSSRLAGGLTHGMAHGFAIYALYWLAAQVLAPWLLWLGPVATLTGGLGLWSAVALGGVVVGGLLFGAYLALMSGLFAQLPNNAFGSLAIEDWKGFLRMRLSPRGLEVLMLGAERVPRGPEDEAARWQVVDRFVIERGGGQGARRDV
jgi:hypothetical protein